MKKMLSMMLIMASFVCLSSCSSDDEDNEGASNPMVGTKWTTSWSDGVEVIEFPTNKDCRNYSTDKNGNIKGDVEFGTYTYNKGYITFYYPNYSAQPKAEVQGDILIETVPAGWTRTYKKK